MDQKEKKIYSNANQRINFFKEKSPEKDKGII